MDEQGAETLGKHQRGLYEALLNDPGPVPGHEAMTPRERFDILITTIQSFLTTDETMQTPALKISNNEGVPIGMSLQLNIQRDENGMPESAEAIWTDDNPEELHRMQTLNGDLRTKYVRHERFAARAVDGPLYARYTNKPAALNNLEHSVAAYTRAFMALSDEERAKLGFTTS